MQELHFASGLKQTNISFIYHGYVSFLESLIKFTFSLCNGIEVFKDGPSINPFLDPHPPLSFILVKGAVEDFTGMEKRIEAEYYCWPPNFWTFRRL